MAPVSVAGLRSLYHCLIPVKTLRKLILYHSFFFKITKVFQSAKSNKEFITEVVHDSFNGFQLIFSFESSRRREVLLVKPACSVCATQSTDCMATLEKRESYNFLYALCTLNNNLLFKKMGVHGKFQLI